MTSATCDRSPSGSITWVPGCSEPISAQPPGVSTFASSGCGPTVSASSSFPPPYRHAAPAAQRVPVRGVPLARGGVEPGQLGPRLDVVQGLDGQGRALAAGVVQQGDV